MKAAYIEATGSPDQIKYGDLPKPEPTAGQYCIKVNAAAVNPIDTYIRSGLVAGNLPHPFIVGADFAGVVESAGPGCGHFRIGDHVWGSNQGMMGRQGTTAEFICVDEQWVYPLPPRAKFVDAAAVALVGITAYLGLFFRAGLREGESVFVSGGSGGVGSMVIQMAKAIGARIITTAGSPEKANKCRSLGADEVILYKTDDISSKLHSMAPNGIDVWFEVHREPNLEMAVPALAKRGRMLLMAGRAARPVLPCGPFYTKDCSLLGFAMFNAPSELQRECAGKIGEWLSTGKLRANIDRTMPFAETSAAHRLQEENAANGSSLLSGKIVLTPQ